jgi:HD superfamily phosphohydrolase
LIDGVVEHVSGNELQLDYIPGLDQSVMQEIKYTSADHALEDFEKLLHLYDLEGEIPELNPNHSALIQIPHCRVPLSHRVREVINHPTFGRLAQVTQLGFVSLIYPGAVHTRLEHVLGTFTHCCEYIRTLWYDQENCLFQCVMSRGDLEKALLACLLHDISQYPMAHDLTEIDDNFAHEPMTLSALERIPPGTEESLADVIGQEWEVDIKEVLQILTANKNSGFRARLLRSIIDGPLDCDKLDYLKRDSTHLGVTFGLALDDERLVRSLTIVYDSPLSDVTDSEGNTNQAPKLETAGLGVAEKAMVVAQALVRTRKDMFTQVYWQHTARSLKAMLAYAVRQILGRIKSDAAASEDFWNKFRQFVFDPLTFRWSDSSTTQVPGESRLDGDVPLESLSIDEPVSSYSVLAPGDDALLGFLDMFSGENERAMLSAIRQRRLYKRIAILSPSRDEWVYRSIYDTYRTYRLEKMIDKIEEQRSEWEKQIKEKIYQALGADTRLLPPGHTVDTLKKEMAKDGPLILVDIPIKATSKVPSAQYIYYLREDQWGVHGRRRISFPSFGKTSLDIADTKFDIDVGKIRVLAHPRWRSQIVRWLNENQILDVLSGVAAE